MEKLALQAGSIFAALAVVLGAFAAHALQSKIPASAIDTFNIGVRYQFYHAFALILVFLLSQQLNNHLLGSATWFFIIGIIFFSGSLYLLATREITGLSASWIGPITPIGGTLFIIGWVLVIISAFKI